MTVGSELWFGLFRVVEETVQRRLQSSKNLFDSLLLETLGQGQSRYRAYRERSEIEIPGTLSPASDSQVAISGFLLAGTAAGDSASSFAAILNAGLKKVSLKHPAPGTPAFANDWKLLLGAAVGIQNAEKLACDGDWSTHRAYVLKSAEALTSSDFTTAIMARFIRQTLKESQISLPASRIPSELSSSELICATWANHVRLSSGIPEEACWKTLSVRLEQIRIDELGFHELSLLLVVLKDLWTVGWISNRARSVEHVKSTLRDFLPCAKRDIKSDLIRNEADVQRIVWSILRPTFPDLVDEDFLPKFGAKNYKPDFGIPSLRLLIEAKYVRASKNVGEIQDELQADVIGYRDSGSEYTAILFFIYDTSGEVAAHTELQRVISEQQGVEGVIVVVGPGPADSPKQKKRANRLKSGAAPG